MAQPARRRLRAARRSGLTSPDPVRTPTAATAPEPAPEPGTRTSRRTGKRQEAHTQTRLGKLLMQESEPETTYRNRPVDRGLGADSWLRLSSGVLLPVLPCWWADVGAERFIRTREKRRSPQPYRAIGVGAG